MDKMKTKTKSILACAVLASVLGGVMPVYAEGETPAVQHRYQLVKVAEWNSGTAIPYGSVVKKADDGKYYLYEIRTGNDTPWGLVGRGINTPAEDKRKTLQYDWHTADATDGKNHLVLKTVSIGDITVIYDGTKVVDTHKTDIDSSVTAYVGAHIISESMANASGGAVRYSSGGGQNITADFIGNFVSGEKGIGGAIFNYATSKIGNITGDFIGNYLLTVGGDTFGGAIINFGEINDITGNFIGNYAVTSNGAAAYGGAICIGFMDPGTINNITGDFIGNYVSGGRFNKGGAICIHRGAIGNITGNFIGNYALGDNASGGAIYNGGTISNITGNFIGNYASDGKGGGAIYNDGTIGNITGDFIGNYASDSSGAYGGAIFNSSGTISILAGDRDVLFSDNRVSASDATLVRGGAIFNESSGTVNLYAADGHGITFEGDASDDNTDSIYNLGTLNINDTKNTYTGTVNLAKVEGDGTMNINGGTVYGKGNITQNTVNLAADASLNVTGTLSMNNGHFTVETDLANSSANCVTLGKLVLNGNLTISVCDTDVVADEGSVTLNNIPVLTVKNGSLPEEKISSANVIVSNVLFAPTITVNANSICLTKLEYTKIHHRYKLNNGVIKTGEVKGTITPWGLVGRGLSTDTGTPLQYKWDTEGKGLVSSDPDIGDITIIYDGKKVVSERQESIDDSVTAYVGASNSTVVVYEVQGGALCNDEDKSGTNITADFIGNYVSAINDIASGGAIYNYTNAKIGNITGDFIANYASGYSGAYGGAIFNWGIINDITGDFIGNYASSTINVASGGAIYNYTNAKIGNITGDFIGNYASGESAHGGAIYNSGNAQIGNITGDFIGNYASGGSAHGGAIFNSSGTISILAGDRNVLFSGNRVSASNNLSEAQGGAIYNNWAKGSIVNLYAAAGHSITFEGDANNVNTDSIYNDGTLNINGTANSNTYTGTVNLAKVEGDGTMNINGGAVKGKGNITQNTLNISGGTLAVTGTLSVNNITFTLPTGVVDNSVIINATNAVSLSGVTVNVYLNNEEPDSITLISKVADSGTYNVYNGTSGTETNADYEMTVENSVLILKSLLSVWYTVGDEEFKFRPTASQSISDNSGKAVVLYRGAGDNNEYKDINITGALTVGGETTTGKSFLVSGDLTANGGVTVATKNTLNVAASNLKSDVTNNGTVNLGAGTLASGSTITGGTLNITGDVTANADDVRGDVNNIAGLVTLTLNGGNLTGEGKIVGATASKLKIQSSIQNSMEIDADGILVSNNAVFTTNADKILSAGQFDISSGAELDLTGGTFNFPVINREGGTVLVVKDATVKLGSGGHADKMQVAGTLDMNGQTNKVTNLDITATGTLDLKNNAYETVVFENLTVAEGAKVNFDANLKGTGDQIKVTTTGSGKLALGSIGLSEGLDGDVGSTKIITFLTGETTSIELTGRTETVLDIYKYIFEPGKDAGTLKVTKDNGFSLHEVITNSKTGAGAVSNYSLKENYDVTENLGTLTRVDEDTPRSLVINGNNHTFDGKTTNAIGVNDGDTLGFKDVTVQGFSDNVAVNNAGTVELDGVTLKSGITGSGSTKIVGNTTLEAKVNQGIIVDTGKTLTTAADNLGGDVTNIGTVNLGAGALATGSTITGGTLNITGDVTANAGDIAGNTNTVAENKTLTFTGGTVSTSLTGAGQYINTGILTVADASNLQMTKAFKNTGTLELQGGNLGAEITDITSAAGTTIISGTVTNTGGKEIFQKNLNIASDGNFTTSADTIYSVEVINDDGNLKLTGGKLERPVQGTGNITFSGDVTTIADNIATTGTNTVETGKKLILDGGTLTKKVQGPGNLNFTGDVTTNAENVATTGINEVATGVTLTFIGGAVGGDISGAGKVEIAGDVTSAKNISNAVIVDSDAKLTNNGGTFTGMVTNSNGATYTITSGTQSNTVVNKGTFYVQGGTVKDYTVDNQGTMNVSGGTVTSDIIVASGAVLNISGGEVQHFDNKGTVNVSNLASLKGNRLYNTDGVVNFDADGTLTFGNIIDGGTLNVNANVTANIGDMTAVTTNIAPAKSLTLNGSGTLSTTLAGKGNVAIGDGANVQTVSADLAKLTNTGTLAVNTKGTLVTAGNNGQLDRDIKGDGTVKLSADTALVNGKSVEGTLDGNNKNVTLVSGTDTANTIDTFTVGTLTGTLNLNLDVDMSSFTSDKLAVTTLDGSVVVNNINVTKEIENNPLELSKEENNKITYLTKTAGNGTTTVKDSAITLTNNYKYTFTAGDTGKLNYKVEAVDLTFKKFIEGNLSGNITTLSLTENLLNSGDGSTAINQAPATVNINLNGHELSSAESSVVTVTTGKTLNINGGSDAQNAGVVDAKTDFTVAGTLAVSGNTDIKGDITNSGTATFAGTTMAEGSLSGEGTYSNSGTLTVADASNLQMVNGLSNSGTLNLGSGTVSALGAKITGNGTTNIQGKVTSDKDIANAVIITADNGELTANGGNITGTVENNNTLNVAAGALKNGVTNKGTMNVTGVASLQSDINNTNGIVNLNADGILATGSTITGGTINVNANVTANASDIAGETNTVAENKTLTFNGGTLTKNVQGAGNVAIGDGTNVQTVSADVGNFANTGNLTVSTKGILNLTAGAVNRQIDNNGTVKLNGATLEGAYITRGTLEFSKIMQVNADYVLADVNTVDAGITLNLGSGTLNKVISGEGAITIAGEVKSVMSNLAAADTMYVEDIGTLELTAGELNRTIINRGTVKLNGATLGSNCIFGGTLEFAADTSVNADYLTADTNKIDSGVTLALSGGTIGNTASIENHGTVDLVSGTYDENLVQGAKDSGTVNLKADAVYQTTAGKVFTEGDAKGKSAGTISQESGSAATLLNFVSGILALTDEQYSLDYLVSAKNALNEFKYDAANLSQTELLMMGTLVNTGTVSLDTIAALGGDVILNDVEVTSDKANLIIGSTDTTGDYKNAVANGFGAGSLNLGTGTDKVTITNGKNLTLGGTEGGTLIKVNGEEKNVNVTVGNGTDASTFNIGNELTPAETKFKLPGTVTVKDNSEVNVKGQANITQALNMAGGEVAVAEGASLNVPEINVTNDAKMSGKIATDKLAGTSGKVIYVGNTNAAGHVSAKETKLNGGILFLDPIWKDGVGIEGATHFTTETTTLDGAYVVGRNSVLTFGATNDDADTQFKTSGLKWGENDITAAVYVADNIDVAGGSLTVDGSLEAAPTAPVAGTVNLAANSLLMVKGDICNTNAAIDNITDADVAEGANLYITDAQQDKPYIIMTGTGIDAENLNTILPYGLVLDEENISISETGVTIQFKPDRDAGQDTVIPNIIKEREGKLKEYVTEISDRYVGNVEKVTEEINNVANLAENLGVTRGAYDVANMVGNAVTNHWDDNPSGSVEPPPLTGRHSGDVWAVYTHRKENVDGLKLGGMDAKYDTQYNGVVVGADLSKGFGIALNYTSGNVNNGLGGHNDAKYYGGSIYGRKAFGNLNLFGDVTYTHGKNELVQNGVEADAKTDTISAGLTAKYLVKAGKFGNIAPFAGVRYMRIDGKDYTDSLGVNRKADKINSVVVPVGLEYAGSFEIENSNWTWKPRLAVGYLFNLGNRDNDITMRYNGAEDIFGYDFADNGAFFANAGMVFERKNFSIGLGYEFMKSKNSRGRRWNVNANVKF